MYVKGKIDGISTDGILWGWLRDENVPNLAVDFFVYFDNEFIGKFRTDTKREDIQSVKNSEPQGFALKFADDFDQYLSKYRKAFPAIDEASSGLKSVSINVKVLSSFNDLVDQKKITLHRYFGNRVDFLGDYIGNIYRFNKNEICGYVYQDNKPEDEIILKLFINDKECKVVKNSNRVTFDNLSATAKKSGFKFLLLKSYFEKGLNKFHIVNAENDKLLFSPFFVNYYEDINNLKFKKKYETIFEKKIKLDEEDICINKLKSNYLLEDEYSIEDYHNYYLKYYTEENIKNDYLVSKNTNKRSNMLYVLYIDNDIDRKLNLSNLDKFIQLTTNSLANSSTLYLCLRKIKDYAIKEYLYNLAKNKKIELFEYDKNNDSQILKELSSKNAYDYISFLNFPNNDNACLPDKNLLNFLGHYKDFDLIYADYDEVVFDDELNIIHTNPKLLPDWDKTFFLYNKYISNSCIFNYSFLKKILSNGKEINNNSLFDSLLNVKNINVKHIPRILFHKFLIFDKKKVKNVDELTDVELVNKTITQNTKCNKKVTIIIPNKNAYFLLKNCVESLFKNTNYKNFELIIIDHQSDDEILKDYYKKIKKLHNAKIIDYVGEFNFAAINNYASKYSNGDLLLFLNNDIEIQQKSWLELLVTTSKPQNVAAVGARLLYPDGNIQHVGICPGVFGSASHAFVGESANSPGYLQLAQTPHELDAVTAACLLVKKSVFQEIEGFDATNFQVAYNDVDLCLQIREKGYKIIYEARAELMHYESVSRGHDDTPQKAHRNQLEKIRLQKKWGKRLLCSPSYNPHFSLNASPYTTLRNPFKKQSYDEIY